MAEPDTEVPETDHPDAPEVQADQGQETDPSAPPASELITTVKTAERAEAIAILNEENARPLPRVTVLRAAETRLQELDLPGQVVDTPPSGAWAQLLNGNGDPVTREGKPVSVPIQD